MNKIVRVQFGNTEISAGSENKLEIMTSTWFDKPTDLLVAVKSDKQGRTIQTMILGTGCVITYQEVQA